MVLYFLAFFLLLEMKKSNLCMCISNVDDKQPKGASGSYTLEERREQIPAVEQTKGGGSKKSEIPTLLCARA
jgi:hypothetical protein